MFRSNEKELVLFAKILILITFVLSILGFILGLYFTFIRHGLIHGGLIPFFRWSAICLGSFGFSILIGRKKWGWFRRKDRF